MRKQSQNILKVISCKDHERTVVYFNGKEIYQSEVDPEGLYRLANKLNWKVENEVLTYEEFSKRFS
jgi:hypothetical protein